MQTRDREAAQRDDDGPSREDHGRSRGGRRPARRRPGVDSFGQILARPRHDEQRVVDADGQPDHDGEHRCDGADLHEGCSDDDSEQPGSHPEDRGDDRRSGCEQGAEGDKKDDRGDEHADDLRRRQGDLRFVPDGAAALDGHGGVCGARLGDERIELRRNGRGLRPDVAFGVPGALVRLNGRQRVFPVGGDAAGRGDEGVGDVRDAVDLLRLVHEGFDRLLVGLDRVFGGKEDGFVHAGSLGQALGQDVDALDRLQSFDCVAAGEVDSRLRHDGAEESNEEQPCGQNAFGVGGAEVPEPIERRRHRRSRNLNSSMYRMQYKSVLEFRSEGSLSSCEHGHVARGGFVPVCLSRLCPSVSKRREAISWAREILESRA